MHMYTEREIYTCITSTYYTGPGAADRAPEGARERQPHARHIYIYIYMADSPDQPQLKTQKLTNVACEL